MILRRCVLNFDRKPGVCGVFSLQVKNDPASRLKCTATLIIDDIQSEEVGQQAAKHHGY